jgi:selenocysteine lyase/cysteine desulfurase
MNLNEGYLRQEFLVKANRIYFDHAKVSPLPRCVRDAVNAFTKDASEHGTKNYKDWMTEVERARGQFARLINSDVEEVAFVKNTSEGISIVANGLDWKAGDNVVVPDIEFPANVYPWWNLKRHGVETRMVKAKGGRVLFDDLVAQTNEHASCRSVPWNAIADSKTISIASARFARNGIFCFALTRSRVWVFCRWM